MKNSFVVFLLLFSSFHTCAQTVTLELGAEKDNSIFSESSSESNGAGINLFAGKIKNGTAVRRALIKFDVSSIPVDAIVQSATFELYVFKAAMNTTTPHRFDLHKITSDWGEGSSSGNGSGAAAQTNDATWSQNFYPSSNWSSSGGDYVALASATDMVSFSESLNKGQWTSSQMISNIDSWRTTPSSNFGWIIIGDETINGSAKAFASKEIGINYAPARPKLIIEYSLPGSTTNSIVINEVNPKKKWVELYNHTSAPVDISNYSFVNGTEVTALTGGTASILNGDLLLDSAEYVVINWPNISEVNGELTLFNADSTSGDLVDYMQYGIGNQNHAVAAVTDNVWDNATSFLPSISDSSNSFSLDTNQVYAGGTETAFTNWLTLAETPTYLNNPCPTTNNLKGNIVEANYYSSNSIEVSGKSSAPKRVTIDATNNILLKPGALIETGSTFVAKIGGCIMP